MRYATLLSEIIWFYPISDMLIEKAGKDYNSPLDDFHAAWDYFPHFIGLGLDSLRYNGPKAFFEEGGITMTEGLQCLFLWQTEPTVRGFLFEAFP